MPAAEKVSFPASDGLMISASLTMPSGSRHGPGGVPAILLCQGLSGQKDLVLPLIAQKFASIGMASLAFDYRGFGESEGPHGWIDPQARVEDALSAFTYLSKRPEVDPKQLAVYGLSLGGPVAIAMAAREPRVRAVVAVSAPANGERMLRSLWTETAWPKFMERVRRERIDRKNGVAPAKVGIEDIFPFSKSFRTKYAGIVGGAGTSTLSRKQADSPKPQIFLASADAILAFRPEEAASRLGDRPLLLIAGEDDDVATPDQVRALYDRASGPRELIMMKHRDHIDLDTGEGLAEQADITSKWLLSHLL